MSDCKFEFLIKRKNYSEFADAFYIAEADYIKVFCPENEEWKSLDNGIGYEYSVGSFTYGFQEEFAGLQFGFYGDVSYEEANNIIKGICKRIEDYSGLETAVVDFNRGG